MTLSIPSASLSRARARSRPVPRRGHGEGAQGLRGQGPEAHAAAAVRVPGDRRASHQAIGAYEVLDRLAARGERLAPISVYRAIDALVAAGIVHRFESRNAFFACHAGHEQRQLVLACEACGAWRRSTAPRCLRPSTSRPMPRFDRRSAKAAVVEVWGTVCQLRRQGRAPCAVLTGLGSSLARMANSIATSMSTMITHGHAHDHDASCMVTTMITTTSRPRTLAHNATALISARNLMLARVGRAILPTSTSTSARARS